MPLRLPPLPPLRLFEAAGRHGSFKAAAEELGVTPSAVSHGIVSLEQWLGADLFDRGPRGLALTADGRNYLPYVSEALSMIAIGTQRVPNRRNEPHIRVSCAPTFASRLLMPVLPRFHAQYPATVVSIDTSHRQVGFPVDGVDLAIRMSRDPWPGLASTRLVAERLVPVCAPAYLASLVGAGGRKTFAEATLLHVTSVTEDWATWLAAAGIEAIDLTRGLRFDEIHLAFEAAAAGLGLAIGRRPLVDAELRRGALVQAADLVIESATSYWLVGSSPGDDRAPIAAFRRWLAEEMAQL